jgi:serine/threonine-protein kinase
MGMVVGARLGGFEITGLLGSGGMGEVYRARDTKLDRDVAIKVLPESFAQDPERVARFEREAKALASLNHPNIGGIHGLEDSGGVAALILELIDGETLADRIARGPIPIDEALPIARQIAEALEAAHEQGIIHRDLKPANIKVRTDGTVKVLDFGLAKLTQPGSGMRDAGSGPTRFAATLSPTITSPALMTGVGVLLGTAAYMSPEQAKGREADKRSDIWAFGCVLYEMLTGRRAFPAEDVSETLAAVLMKEPDWTALPAATPSAVANTLRRCLQRDRKQRARDVGDVALGLDGAFEPVSPLPAAEVPSRRRMNAVVWSLVVAFAAVIGGGVTWYLKPERPAPTMRFAHSLGRQTFTRGGRHLLDISSDGTRVVYVADEQLHLRSLDDAVAQPIAGTAENPNSPAFSPDGQWIAYFAGQEIKKISVGGGTPVAIVRAGNPFGLSWAHDNTILYGQQDGIWRVPADSGTPAKVVAAADGERLTGPHALPGGNALLFATSKPGREESEIVVQRLATGARTVVRSGASPRYVSTGHLVFALGEALLAQPFDLDTLQIRGGPVPVVPQVRRALATGLSQYAVSDGGTLVYTIGLDSSDVLDLALIDRAGTVTRLPSSRAAMFTPRFSPDDRRIAARRADQEIPNVWIYEIRDAQWRQLTFDGGDRPIWTPDGKAITFHRSGGLWQVAADFSGAPQQLPGTSVPGLVGPEAWSPDGKVLLFRSPAGLHAFSPEEKRVSLELPKPERADVVRDATFSPDGRWVAYSIVGSENYVAISPYPFAQGSRRRVVNETANRLIWSRAGRELFFSRVRGGVGVTEVGTEPTLTWKNPTTAIELPAATTGGVGAEDVSADGQRILVTLRRAGDDDSGQSEIQIVVNWLEELKQRVSTR